MSLYEKIFNLLRYLMGASCGGDISDERVIAAYHQVGLEAQHAYSVLDVQQIGTNR